MVRAHRWIKDHVWGVQGDFWGPLLQEALKLWRGGFGKSLLVWLWLLGQHSCFKQELVLSPLLFVVLEDVTSNAVCHTQVWGCNSRMQFVMVRYAWATYHSLCHVPIVWVFSSFSFAKGNKIRFRWKDEKCHDHLLQQWGLGNQIFSLYHPRVFSFCSAPWWWGDWNFGILPESHHITFCVKSAGVLVTEHRRISVTCLVLQWCFISVHSPFLHHQPQWFF